MCKAKGYANQFSILYENLKNDHQILAKELSRTDLLIQDVLHNIEFGNFNVVQGYKFAKQIQEIRNQRREIKDEKEAILSLIQQIQPVAYKILKAEKRIDNLIVLQQKRTYTPRILKHA